MTVQRIDFNPRTRVGYDSVTFETPAYTDWISIHVPAWGTTRQKESIRAKPFISIHVPAWGTTQNGDEDRHYRSISIHVPAWGTTDQGLHFDRILQFQSTYPRGVRPGHDVRSRQPSHFNPRTRVGYDCPRCTSPGFCEISIHVPAWGTTLQSDGYPRYPVYFNPRTRVGYDASPGS